MHDPGKWCTALLDLRLDAGEPVGRREISAADGYRQVFPRSARLQLPRRLLIPDVVGDISSMDLRCNTYSNLIPTRLKNDAFAT